MPTLVNLTCMHCGRLFVRSLAHANMNRKRGTAQQYCSRECRVRATDSTSLVRCARCGQQVQKRRRDIDRVESVYCSRACANAANNARRRYDQHPNFTDGHTSYRQRAFDAHGQVCTVPGCGYANAAVLEVHHRDGNRRNNRIENLDVLCPTHHAEYELGIRRYA
jgi:DNA-directed RNA polymerase subunit RPC12/RpoP